MEMSNRLIPKIILTFVCILAAGFVAYHPIERVLDKALMSEMCSNTVFAESQSPDSKLKAIVFGRSCGATDGVSTQISILPVNEDLPNKGGNICGVSVFPKVELRWIGNRCQV